MKAAFLKKLAREVSVKAGRHLRVFLCGIVLISASGMIAASIAGNHDPVGQEKPRKLRIFLFAGQSNMAGADSLISETGAADLVGSGLQTAADRNCLFTYGPGLSETSPLYFAWGEIRGHRGSSLGAVDPPVYCHGPEVGFARTLYGAGITNIAIIKVATNFQKLETSRSPWVKPNSIYRRWRRFVADRLAELAQKKHSWSVAGFVWHQGIDDGILGRSLQDYETDLRQIIADLRENYANAKAPFLLARSVNSPIAGSKKMAPIRAAQVAVAQSVPMADWIDLDDLAPYVNRHHLAAASQLTAGERFGRAYLELTGIRIPRLEDQEARREMFKLPPPYR